MTNFLWATPEEGAKSLSEVMSDPSSELSKGSKRIKALMSTIEERELKERMDRLLKETPRNPFDDI